MHLPHTHTHAHTHNYIQAHAHIHTHTHTHTHNTHGSREEVQNIRTKVLTNILLFGCTYQSMF